MTRQNESDALDSLLWERARLIAPLCAIYLLYGGLDWVRFPEHAARWLGYRFGVFLAILALHPFLVRRSPPKVMAFVYLYFFLATFGINLMIFESGGFESSYFVGLMVTAGLLGVVFPMNARRMAPAMASALVPYVALCLLRGESSLPRIVENCTFLVSAGVFVMFGGHLAARLLAKHHRAEAETARLVAELEESVRRDPLTGIFNRRYLEERLSEEFARYLRRGQSFTVILADLDHFKLVNDRFGHCAGDRALRAVSAALASATRAENVLCRYGGEEFALLLPGTNLRAAGLAAEQLRGAVEILDLSSVGVPVELTLSLGVAEIRRGEDAAGVLERADAALYRAKGGGRNRVECAAPETPASP